MHTHTHTNTQAPLFLIMSSQQLLSPPLKDNYVDNHTSHIHTLTRLQQIQAICVMLQASIFFPVISGVCVCVCVYNYGQHFGHGKKSFPCGHMIIRYFLCFTYTHTYTRLRTLPCAPVVILFSTHGTLAHVLRLSNLPWSSMILEEVE